MKHVANIMRFNDWNTEQESTIGRIFAEGRGRKKTFFIEWIGQPLQDEIKGCYYDACAAAINTDKWNFVSRI